MAVNPTFRTFVVEQLSRVVPRVHARGMFGGVGIYAGDVFFGLIDDDVVYFKVDDSNRRDYEARGMGPFRPYGESGEVMQYYQLPDDVLEDTETLRGWVDRAIAVARAKKIAKLKKNAKPKQRVTIKKTPKRPAKKRR